MSEPPADPANEPLVWTDDDQPRSRLYGDVYFSAEDGLAESRAVYLRGCGLPDAWRDRRRFVVGELGFGTGLNILALLDLWKAERPVDGRLHIFSIEAHPLSQGDARRALANWPELAALAEPLLARWPGRARGVHRVEFPGLGAILDVAVGEVGEMLAGWSGRADAWFLDGFSPALNPAMWRDEVLALVGARSAPGAQAATFTVAGQVRRGLTSAGFQVEKQPGFGRKRERLAARLPGKFPDPSAVRRVAIIGAGIAGAAAARAVRALGGEALVIEARSPGAGASGNPAALVTPRLDAGLGPAAQLFAQAFRRAVALYGEVDGAILSRGVLQLAGAKDGERFARIAASDLFEPQTLELLTAAETHARLGEPASAALDQTQALVIAPLRVLADWAPDTLKGEVATIAADGEGWRLSDAAGQLLAQADAVILAGGFHIPTLTRDVALQPVRGQVSWSAGVADPPPPVAWGGYALPLADGVMFGATHDRDDKGDDLRNADHRRNLETLSSALPERAARIDPARLTGRAAVRAATSDRLPIAGAAPGELSGLFVLGGFGSRGFSFAPLLAEHVAALALGAPSPLSGPLAETVAPDRFLRRAQRHGS